MPKLTEDNAAFGMNRVHHLLPCSHLLFIVDPRDVREPSRRVGDHGPLGDEEPAGRRPLRVVLRHRRPRDPAQSPAPRHRRQHDPVGEVELAHLVRREEVGVRHVSAC